MERLSPEEMSENASQAELDAMFADIPLKSLQDVAKWWRKWYLKAGHKRLGRILLQFANEDAYIYKEVD